MGKAMAKQISNGRNGYTPIMTDHGFVAPVSEDCSNGYTPIMTDHGFVEASRKDCDKGIKPTQSSGKNENEMTTPMMGKCDKVIKVNTNAGTGGKDLLGNCFDEVDDGSQFKQNTEADHQERSKEEKEEDEGRKDQI